MTREEAIHRLKNTAWLGTNKDREETEQAVDMAIEALSADAVSREEYEEVKEEYINTVGAILAVISAPSCLKEGDTKYYYCALEDRPNRNWSVDDTDFCSWGERSEEWT